MFNISLGLSIFSYNFPRIHSSPPQDNLSNTVFCFISHRKFITWKFSDSDHIAGGGGQT